MAERAYPSTSAGWQNMQRLALVGALGGDSHGGSESGLEALLSEDWPRTKITQPKKNAAIDSDRTRAFAVDAS